jgi:hypothetical protein
MWVSHFHRLLVFSPYSRSYSVYFLYFTCFTVSRHIQVPTVWLSHFSRFSVFLTIFQVIQWLCLIFPIFQFSHQNPGPTVCIYHISRFSISRHIPVPTVCVFLILHVFQGFLPYFISFHVSFSFSSFLSFLAIFQDLQCEFLISLVGQISRHIPVPRVCISHLHVFQCFSPHSRSYSDCVSFSLFFGFLTQIQVSQCVFLIFQVFHCFSPYSRSCSVCLSFCTFFSVSRHISFPTMCVSHFHHLSFFLSYSRYYSVHFSFFTFFSVSCHIPFHTVFVSHFTPSSLFSQQSSSNRLWVPFYDLQCVFLILLIFQCFLPYFIS